jgi:hypothetical protein
MNTNRRQFSRIAFHSPAELITAGATCDVVIIDLSLKGALLRLPVGTGLKSGENCTLHLRLGELNAALRMQGVLAHTEGLYAGLGFRTIDLDSATHLRRLVELNLGDPALLERELSSLVGE